MSGRLEVIRGCMFAGKTEELIRRLGRLRYAKQTYVVFKPAIDSRYSDTEIVSHNGVSIAANVVSSVEQIQAALKNKLTPNVIAIDEAQFFEPELVALVRQFVSEGYRVIAVGLDTDFRGDPFPNIADLLALADEDIHLNAICTICGKPGTRTQRLVDGKPAKASDPLIVVGAADKYEARCRQHHYVL